MSSFFAQWLTDYDPAVNNGSWQWAASTGCDAQPYFRIFNPWLQQKRFDPECIYIKRWLPELKSLSPKYIHTMYEEDITRSVNYPRPIVEHSVQKVHAEEMFRECHKWRPTEVCFRHANQTNVNAGFCHDSSGNWRGSRLRHTYRCWSWGARF